MNAYLSLCINMCVIQKITVIQMMRSVVMPLLLFGISFFFFLVATKVRHFIVLGISLDSWC